MELLAKYCNEKQKKKWLHPIMRGEMFTAYSMTEPDRASSDATQINCRLTRDPNDPNTLIINGRKFYGNCIWQEDLGMPKALADQGLYVSIFETTADGHTF